jgi:hypothetical protein
MGGLTDSSDKGLQGPDKYESRLGVNAGRMVSVQCGDPPSSVPVTVIFAAGSCTGAAATSDQTSTDIERLRGKGSWRQGLVVVPGQHQQRTAPSGT